MFSRNRREHRATTRRFPMLVLSRKRSERIWIGDDVCITIVKLDRHQVRLGIDAPSDISIVREEVLLEFDTDADEVDTAREGAEALVS
jgi:carbon storage regulator